MARTDRAGERRDRALLATIRWESRTRGCPTACRGRCSPRATTSSSARALQGVQRLRVAAIQPLRSSRRLRAREARAHVRRDRRRLRPVPRPLASATAARAPPLPAARPAGGLGRSRHRHARPDDRGAATRGSPRSGERGGPVRPRDAARLYKPIATEIAGELAYRRTKRGTIGAAGGSPGTERDGRVLARDDLLRDSGCRSRRPRGSRSARRPRRSAAAPARALLAARPRPCLVVTLAHLARRTRGGRGAARARGGAARARHAALDARGPGRRGGVLRLRRFALDERAYAPTPPTRLDRAR